MNQTVVLWDVYGRDDYGNVLLEAPVELKVRLLRTRSRSGGPQSDVQSKPGPTMKIDRDVQIGAIVWDGRKYDLPPADGDLKWQVTGYEETPDLKAHRSYRQVTLERFTGPLPTVLGT